MKARTRTLISLLLSEEWNVIIVLAHLCEETYYIIRYNSFNEADTNVEANRNIVKVILNHEIRKSGDINI